MYKPKFVVIIPTYLRTEVLGRCFEALEKQTRLPDEVIVVRRDSDVKTKELIDNYGKKEGALKILALCVTEPGFLPPIKEGLKVAQGDYVGILDDDVLVNPNWIETGLSIFRENDPRLGAIGGASIAVNQNGTVFPSKLLWVGRFVALNIKDKCTENINAFSEGNLIMRGEASKELVVDLGLNTGGIAHHGLDFGLQLINHGWKIKYDPRLNAEHLALRAVDGTGGINNIKEYIHNLIYIVDKHFGKIRLIIFVLYNLVIGQCAMPGLVYGLFRQVTPLSRVRIAQRALILELFQRI